jgi:hypothetical protein
MNYIISFAFPEDYRKLYKNLRVFEREELRIKVRELVYDYLVQKQNQNFEKHEMDKTLESQNV